MVGHQPGITHLVLTGSQLRPGAFQLGRRCVITGLVLVPDHGTDSAFFIKGGIPFIVFLYNLIIGKGRLVRGLSRVITLLHILRIQLHQHLTGPDFIA